MKKLFIFVILLLPVALHAQVASLVAPNNNNYAGLEKNLLFYANTRFVVSQTGNSQFSPSMLFDGRYDPNYIPAPAVGTPTVVLIEGLPDVHTQKVACIGWTTRYWPPTHFKIEGYNPHASGWETIADVTGNAAAEYITTLYGYFTKLRFIFYDGTGTDGALGISELFYLHNEFVQAYDGLMVKYDEANNVSMGHNARLSNLLVNGNITTKKVKVTQQGWSDFVFDSSYQLPAIPHVEEFIQQNKHLPGIPSAKEVEKDGVDLGDISAKLLQKIEELTLYLIDQNKKLEALSKENKLLTGKVEKLEQSIQKK
jgi:hypothetical protein